MIIKTIILFLFPQIHSTKTATAMKTSWAWLLTFVSSIPKTTLLVNNALELLELSLHENQSLVRERATLIVFISIYSYVLSSLPF